MFEKFFAVMLCITPFVFGFMSLLSWFQMRDGMCALYGFLCIASMGLIAIELN